MYNMSGHYGLTVKCIKAGYYASEDELHRMLQDILAYFKGILVDKAYIEKDTMGRNHLHCYFRARKNIRRDIYRRRFWSIHIDELPTERDIDNWVAYIKKEDSINEAALMGQYLFTD